MNVLKKIKVKIGILIIFLSVAFSAFAFDFKNSQINEIKVDKNLYTLSIYSDGKLIDQYDVIIGKKGTPTPRMDVTIESIDINPTWNPTVNSQKQIRKHPELIKKFGIKFRPDGSMYSPPGPNNPLGIARINLTYYNKPIKIHGTNEPELFETEFREYSAGCVRVLDIKNLVETLLADQIVDWSSTKRYIPTTKVRVVIQ